MVSSSVRSVLFNSFVPCVTVVFLFCTFELVSITTADGSVGAGSLGPVVVLLFLSALLIYEWFPLLYAPSFSIPSFLV
jgi:hypothetical protein